MSELPASSSGPARAARRVDPRILDLVLYKTFADLRAEAAKTYVNYLWWVLDPILSMLVFYLVFGVIFGERGEGFVAFLLVGLVFWTWYRQTIAHAGNAIVLGKGLMDQVHVPKPVFPIVTLMTDLTKFAVVLAVLLLFLWVSGYGIGASYLALPLVLLTQLLLCSALALLFSALVPFLPDLRFVVDNLLNLQFFVSGIFFSAERVPEAYRFWFYLNPMASLIEDYRAILLEQSWPHWGRLSVIALLALVGTLLALWVLERNDRVYPRVVR